MNNGHSVEIYGVHQQVRADKAKSMAPGLNMQFKNAR